MNAIKRNLIQRIRLMKLFFNGDSRIIEKHTKRLMELKWWITAWKDTSSLGN